MSSGNAPTTQPSGGMPELRAGALGSALLTVVHCPTAEVVSRTIELHPDSPDLLIGRDVSGGLALSDPRISRLHFRVVWDASQAVFRAGDAQSFNNTYVNGEPIRTRILSHGDVIRCGDTLLVFEMQDVMEGVRNRARRYAPTQLAVLIQGETGVGKEIIARAIHEQSGRRGKFVAINCAALPKDLAAAELFGHKSGAFSGAAHSRAGFFLTADAGTLLLDEIGDLPLDLQPTLLRVLEENSVRPLGSDHTIGVDVRVLAATHFDLDAQTDKGLFRADLLARLAQCRLFIPPLRERRSEVLALARGFAQEQGFELELSANAAEALLLWRYPFNVRELRSLTKSCCTEQAANGSKLVDLPVLKAVDPRLVERGSFTASAEPKSGRDGASRRMQLQQLLRQHRGNVSKVAAELGCDRSQVYRWMQAYGLSVDSFRRCR